MTRASIPNSTIVSVDTAGNIIKAGDIFHPSDRPNDECLVVEALSRNGVVRPKDFVNPNIKGTTQRPHYDDAISSSRVKIK